MALSIKNERTEALARQLARVTGTSITQAVTDALESRLALVGPTSRRIDWDAVAELTDGVAALDVRDARPHKELTDELWGHE